MIWLAVVGVIGFLLYVACFSLVEAALTKIIGAERAKTIMTVITWLLILTLCIGFCVGIIYLGGWLGVAILVIIALIVGGFMTL